MNPNNLQFCCSRCFKRYCYEEIFTTTNEGGDMLCNDCRNATAKSKCSYCRSEFQQSGKPSSNACPKCFSSLKLYGKPAPCSLCSINAAFKTDKCHRCTSSEYKFGKAVKCEICQTVSAFNREDHRVDGKLHCWLCKASYKRALHKAKAKKSDNEKSRSKKRSADEASMKATHKVGNSSSANNRGGGNSSQQVPEKIQKTGNAFIPSNNSDHVVLVTTLRETITQLQKKLQQKDGQLLQKDKEITEWKSKHFTIEGEMRNRQKDQERVFESKIDVLNKKVQMQLKEIAQLSKLSKRNERQKERKEVAKVEKENNTSGSDSPNNN